MKKLLVYAHYYYPDVASTGQILTELCESLVEKFDVTVICTVPSYTGKIDSKYKKEKFYFEEINGVHVVRVNVPEFDKKNKISRIKNIYAYYKNAIKVTKKLGKFDLVYALSQPPILGGLLGRKGKKITKGKLIYNIQDFNPEQIKAVKFSKNKLLTNTLMKMDKKTCKNSDLIITVGNDMKETLKNRFKNEEVPNNVVINNWIDEKEIYPMDKNNKKIKDFKKKYNLENKFIVMYSGNIGLYYDLENIIKLYKDYKDNKDIAFVFVGEGSVKNKLQSIKKEEKLNNVIFIPYQDKKDLNISLNVADVHLVTNAKGIKGVSVPSKIYGCLATNIPVFGILEKGSEAWNIIEKSKCGLLSETGNYDDVKKKLDYVIKNKEKFVKKYSTGRKYLEENLAKDKSINKYKKEIGKITDIKPQKKKFSFTNLIFYLAVFTIPFDNLWFAPSRGWATIAPIIFALYFLLNIKTIIKNVSFKDILPVSIIMITFSVLNFVNGYFNINRVISALISLGLGITMYYSFKTYYQKNKSVKKIATILLIAYSISLLVGVLEWVAIKYDLNDVISTLRMIFKRSVYLTKGRVQYTFTEPSFISLHLYGIMLPIYFISKNKKMLGLIVLFIILSFIFKSSLRFVVDSIVVITIFVISWFLSNKKRIYYIFIIISAFCIAIPAIYNSNGRFRRIINNGVYIDSSLSSRYFFIESSVYGYTNDPINLAVGYGLGNSIVPISHGYDQAFENYKNHYVNEISRHQTYETFRNDNSTFCLYIRLISEFGIIVVGLLLFKFIKIFKNSKFKSKIPLVLIGMYLYIQFDSYTFYTLWLILAVLVLTHKGGLKNVNKTNK